MLRFLLEKSGLHLTFISSTQSHASLCLIYLKKAKSQFLVVNLLSVNFCRFLPLFLATDIKTAVSFKEN